MKKYWQFIKESRVEEIHRICKEYHIENYTINPDGSVDVDGDVEIYIDMLNKLPIEFGKVVGNFKVRFNHDGGMGLTTLENSPREVYGDFAIPYSNIVSLIGGPERVHGDYNANDCGLITLEGFPEYYDPRQPVHIPHNPVQEITNLLETSIKLGNVIYILNEEMPIDPDTMEVSYTILCEVYERLGKDAPQFEDIELKHYTLVD